MHLSVDTAGTHLDLEKTLVTPGVVPGVDAKPVVLTRVCISTPTDGLDGVTTESISSFMLVDTGGVGEEIFIDGEGSSDGTVLSDIGLDVLNSTESIAGSSGVLVIRVNSVGVIRASLGAGWCNLSHGITLG